MRNRLGRELYHRPLHFIWICDCSGSMSIDGKIETLNQAIFEALPHMKVVADENPNASVMIRCLKFSHGAIWHVEEPVPLDEFEWAQHLEADPLARPTVDVVFMIDTSGSMSDEIEAVKSSCLDFADRISREGANVNLGLVGFDIGGHHGSSRGPYAVHNLSRYTIGVWPISTPADFMTNVRSLSVGLFGGSGCYLANRDTVDIFPHVVRAFSSGERAQARVLVIISDEMDSAEGVQEIVTQLKGAGITAHVMGVSGGSRAHELIASQTGGKFVDILRTKGVHSFQHLLGDMAETIAKEVTRSVGGQISYGTDMGAAMRAVSEVLGIPPMPDRALPPVLVLISDGQPTDDFDSGLDGLMALPWGKKSVRIAIGVGKDADLDVLQRFIGHVERAPVRAENPEMLVRYIQWASTVVLKSASSPGGQAPHMPRSADVVPIPAPPEDTGAEAASVVW